MGWNSLLRKALFRPDGRTSTSPRSENSKQDSPSKSPEAFADDIIQGALPEPRKGSSNGFLSPRARILSLAAEKPGTPVREALSSPDQGPTSPVLDGGTPLAISLVDSGDDTSGGTSSGEGVEASCWGGSGRREGRKFGDRAPHSPTEKLQVVSLLGSATEIIALLGLQHLLVGRSHECKRPASVLSLPCVSSPAMEEDVMISSSLAIDSAVSGCSGIIYIGYRLHGINKGWFWNRLSK